MITGLHAMVYNPEAGKTRAFFRDVLGFKSVDAGEGWLIFKMPPAELGVHPTEPDAPESRHELHFMCDDVNKTVAELKARGVEFTQPITDQGYGLVTAFRIPGGQEVGLYQPRHPTAHRL